MLSPRADGLLQSATPVRLPFMAPRLQGTLRPDGHLDLALWGKGPVGRASMALPRGPYLYAPNRMTWRGGGIFVAQSAPVLLVKGAELRWTQGLVTDGSRIATSAAGLALSAAQIEAEAEAHVRRCDRLPDAGPLLRTMVMHGVHAALSSARQDEHGGFAGLSAGLAYSAPARTYYRDAYWTTPLLLQVAPHLVRAEIDLLARGVRPDGEAPSGVVLDPAWRGDPQVHRRPGEWWSDHFDSPLAFVLMVRDYQAATGDPEPAGRYAPLITAIAERYRRLAGPDGLPKKPRHDRDWADNVFRSGHVAYDLGLWFGAFGTARDRPAIDQTLWRGDRYADYAAPDGFSEDHLALDTLTLLRFRAVSDDRAVRALESCRRLETDWGVRSVHPPYARRGDLRGKSAFNGRYHNGGDWPWLDGLYADELLRRGRPGWRAPLSRWWETCLARGWPGAVEHLSPAFGRGSLLQAWSSFPAAVALQHRDQVLAADRTAVIS